MSINSTVLYWTNYHRNLPSYDKLSSQFPNLYVQMTANTGYTGVASQIIYPGKPMNYDESMVSAQQYLKEHCPPQIETIVFIDNDCFIKDFNYIDKLVNQFQQEGYTFASFFEGWEGGKERYDTLCFGDDLILPVLDQQFIEVPIYPGFKPRPHWENALMLVDKQALLLLDSSDISHGRKLIRALWEQPNSKLGVHKASYKGHTHYGPGWFHIGALMSIYYAFEQGNTSFFSNPSSEFLARLGFILSEFPSHPNTPLFNNLRDQSMSEWYNLTRGTCLEF